MKKKEITIDAASAKMAKGNIISPHGGAL